MVEDFNPYPVGEPPCKVACPARTDARRYIELLAHGDFSPGLEVARAPNPFPGSCGRICTRPCEDVCRRGSVESAIAIAQLKRFLFDRAWKGYSKLVRRAQHRVAVVGAGPAGITAARDLALAGCQVTVFEGSSQKGGMLRFGVPVFRLPRPVLHKEIEAVQDLGVEIKDKIRVGVDVTLDELASTYEATFLAVGAALPVALDIEGENLGGVYLGLEFLGRANRGSRIEVGERVAAIGGGNTALDVARTARRLGAADVTVYYRRSSEEMPALPHEITDAKEEGVKFEYLTGPTKISGREGKASELHLVKMQLGEPDASGRRRPIPIEGTDFKVPVDTVIAALGQIIDFDFLKDENLGIEGKGRLVAADPSTLATNIPGVFAGGDAVTGAGTLIDAVASGRRAAASILEMLEGVAVGGSEADAVESLSERVVSKVKPAERIMMPAIASSKRVTGFDEVEAGFSLEQAVREAQRCMNCAAQAVVRPEACVTCLTCVRICPFDVPYVEGETAVITADCQACGICVPACPTKAISFPYYENNRVFEKVEMLVDAESWAQGARKTLCFYCPHHIGLMNERPVKGVRFLSFLCTAKITADTLLEAFEHGADGIIVAACPSDDCWSYKGSYWSRKWTDYTRALMKEIGLEEDRLIFYEAKDAAQLTELCLKFRDELEEMPVNPMTSAGPAE